MATLPSSITGAVTNATNAATGAATSLAGAASKAIQLPGSIIDAATKAANAAKAKAEAAVPSFDSLMNAAKSSVNVSAAAVGTAGGLFKDISSSINSVATSFGVGGPIAPPQAAVDAFNNYKKQLADAQKNAVLDVAVAKAALAQKVKEATAKGEQISTEAINSALGPTKMLQQMQANLTNPAAIAQLTAESAAAKAEAITSLKANTMLAMLTKPLPTAIAGAMSSNMDPALVNSATKLNIIKAQETSATQPVPGQRPPASTVRPTAASVSSSLDSPAAPPIAPPPVDRRVYTAQVVAYEDKKFKAKTAYLAHLGLTWSKGQPDFTKAERDAGLLAELDKVYDAQVGRPGANDDRKSAAAIKKAKPPADRTPEETALIDKVEAEKKTFYSKEWWTKRGELYDTYDKYYENYKLVYDCWINNGDRFSLPAAVEKELAAG